MHCMFHSHCFKIRFFLFLLWEILAICFHFDNHCCNSVTYFRYKIFTIMVAIESCACHTLEEELLIHLKIYPGYKDVVTKCMAIKERVKIALQRVEKLSCNYLIQFWASIVIYGQTFLTTSDQPFGLTRLDGGLCSYRHKCLSRAIPVELKNGTQCENDLGPPGRVFKYRCNTVEHNGIPLGNLCSRSWFNWLFCNLFKCSRQ
uniref:Uncharacterized protein n=1 Tax=Nicotiana tabacum TaxID=4097 RepID=A0A1S4BPC5_TOBAC|nr:PREDICTED: uncharacterized protein LOC107810424 [Nicotiana tabacum]